MAKLNAELKNNSNSKDRKCLIGWFVQMCCNFMIKIDDMAISQAVINVATFSAITD